MEFSVDAWLCEERARLRLPQATVARKLGISRPTLAGYENGLRQPPFSLFPKLQLLGYQTNELPLCNAIEGIRWDDVFDISLFIIEEMKKTKHGIHRDKAISTLKSVYASKNPAQTNTGSSTYNYLSIVKDFLA